MTDLRLLGALEFRVAGVELDLGPPKQRAVFAALVVDANQPVAVSTLIDRVWGDEPPAEARNALYAHIMRIRRLLTGSAAGGPAPGRLDRRSGGYLLSIDPEAVDLHRFRSLVERAGAAGRSDEERATLFGEALRQWRGDPFADLSGAWIERVREGCHRQRLEAMVGWARVELRLGHHDAVIARVPGWVDEHPLVEPLRAALMRALHAAGRPAEALDHYAGTRQRLLDELGVEPGVELRQLHQAILRAESPAPAPAPPAPPAQAVTAPVPPAPAVLTPVAPAPTAPASADAVPSAPDPVDGQPGPAQAETAEAVAGAETAEAETPGAETVAPEVPAQLPVDVPGFTGREEELGQLDAVLAAVGEHPTAAVIATLSGTAGVGKSALAVHWAHRLVDRFPDGQLYVNLRGFESTGAPVKPEDAVRAFLDAFAVSPQRIPASAAAQEGLYRSLLAERRVVVVLDNARDAEQVRPLLPGAPHCLTVVTSRDQLTGLIAAEGAYPITLDLLPVADARELLARRLGARRIAAEPAAVDDIIARCARLPLALAIVAARAATHPGFPLAMLAAELADIRRGLDAFAAGDAATDLRAVFFWSYRTLSPDAARMFRLLGEAPGPDVSVPAAASLAAMPARQIWSVLAELARAHLVTERTAGRYTFHDLLRTYAAEQAGLADSGTQRHAALHRLLDHYLQTARAADELLDPHRDPIAPPPPLPGVLPEVSQNQEQALAWFAVEQPALLAAIEEAARQGFDTHAWQLAWTLTTFFERQGHWQRQAVAQHTALESARRAGDRAGQAHANRCLGRAYARLGDDVLAQNYLEQALELLDALGDRIGLARTHLHLSWVFGKQNRDGEAVDAAGRALELFEAAGHRAGQARALNTMGWYEAQRGNYRQALTCCRGALALLQGSGDQHGQADTWDSIGYAHHLLGEHEQAIAGYRRAIELYRATGGRHGEADSLARLGDAHLAGGDRAAATLAWRQALTILDELGHPGAEELRAKLGHRRDNDARAECNVS
jgi:DNA-binding SARP family transcriptional activator/tetratricopeptide (TPR) repeat protein